MIKIFSRKLKRFFITICITVYLFDLFLLIKTDRVESFLSYPIYLLKATTAYLSRSQLPVKPAKAFTIALIGDSMTDYLKGGQNELKNQLKIYYPDKDFVIYNYGFGSTNILSVMNRLTNNVSYQGSVYPAILGEQYDLIILESFGNNPLSQFSIEEGLKKQTQELDKIASYIARKHPRSYLAFMATISPNKFFYGTGVVNLNQNTRIKWSEERVQYIKNHIKYAKDHKIPLINAFDDSIENGTGNISYLNPGDYIHPSLLGINFIIQKISQEIYKQRILPL